MQDHGYEEISIGVIEGSIWTRLFSIVFDDDTSNMDISEKSDERRR